MKKTLIAAALASALAVPAFAQTNDESKDAAAPAGPHTLTANVGLFSSYLSLIHISQPRGTTHPRGIPMCRRYDLRAKNGGKDMWTATGRQIAIEASKV